MEQTNWEEEFDKKFPEIYGANTVGTGQMREYIKSFISSLLQKEREESGKEGYRRGWHDYKKSWNSLNTDKQTELLLKHYKKLEYKNGFIAGYKAGREEIFEWAEKRKKKKYDRISCPDKNAE